MTIYDILEKAISFGVEADFRGKKAYDFLWKEIIDSGDGRVCTNIYPDTGVVTVSSLQKHVKRVVVGIDIGTPEIIAMTMWAKNEGKEIDLFIGHHPEGRLNSAFPFILYSHIGNLKAFGVDVSHIKDKYDKLVNSLLVDNLSSNFVQVHDTVKYLGVNYISIHTPADNLGAQFVLNFLKEKNPSTLQDTISTLLQIKEYSYYEGVDGVIPMIISGLPSDMLGNFTVTEFTGGEEGPVESFVEMKIQGIDTVLCMHMTQEGVDKCREIGLNVIATGHMNSDSIGLNLVCDTLEKEGIEIIPISGFVRVPRGNY